MSEAYQAPELFPPNGATDSSDAPTDNRSLLRRKLEAEAEISAKAQAISQAEKLNRAARAEGLDPNTRRTQQLATSGAGGGLSEAVAGDLSNQNQVTEAPPPKPLRKGGRRPGPSAGREDALQLEAETQDLLRMRREGGDPQAVAKVMGLRDALATSASSESTEEAPTEDPQVHAITSPRLAASAGARAALEATKPAPLIPEELVQPKSDEEQETAHAQLDEMMPRRIDDPGPKPGGSNQHDGRAPYPFQPTPTPPTEPRDPADSIFQARQAREFLEKGYMNEEF